MTDLTVTFAGVSFHLQLPQGAEITRAFEPFVGGTGDTGWDIVFRAVSELPQRSEPPLLSGAEYSLYRTPSGPMRCFCDPMGGGVYAAAFCEAQQRRVTVCYLPGTERFFSQTGNSLYHSGWESLLLRDGGLILHAACVDTPYGGLLFAGESGVGKSTQAALWQRYAGAELINGDRPILRKENGAWLAYGSPYAGSSGCHVNRSCPVRAVILLKQAPVNQLVRLSPAQALRSEYALMTVPDWDDAAAVRASELAGELAQEIPAWELCCTPDARAVTLLREALQKETGACR